MYFISFLFFLFFFLVFFSSLRWVYRLLVFWFSGFLAMCITLFLCYINININISINLMLFLRSDTTTAVCCCLPRSSIPLASPQTPNHPSPFEKSSFPLPKSSSPPPPPPPPPPPLFSIFLSFCLHRRRDVLCYLVSCILHLASCILPKLELLWGLNLF